MATWLDIVGSVIIGTIALMLLLKINFQISTNSREISTNGMVQSNISTLGSVIDNDLYKIGYRVNGSPIINASLNQISYLTDLLDNGGTPDSVRFYLGDTSQARSTTNPNDKPLFKVINGVTKTMAFVRDCNFTYYDTSGFQILYTNPNLAKLTHSIKVNIVYESPYMINNYYQVAEYSRKIKPMNLK